MMIRKEPIVVLVSFCICAALFFAVPTRSATSDYDPWADINGDGKIDMMDIAYSARLFGAFGDSSKNVNVTNLPLDEHGNLRTTLSSRLSVHKEVVESEAFNWIYEVDSTDYGTFIDSDVSCNMIFSFNAKTELLNITELWVSVIVAQHTGDQTFLMKFNISFNGMTIFAGTQERYTYGKFVTAHSIRIDPSVYTEIHTGINTLTLSEPTIYNPDQWVPAHLHIYKVTVYIEYEYEA